MGVNVNAIAPGFVATDMTEATAARLHMSFEDFQKAASGAIPVGRVGQPQDIAATAAFLTQRRGLVHHRPDPVRRRRPDARLTRFLDVVDAQDRRAVQRGLVRPRAPVAARRVGHAPEHRQQWFIARPGMAERLPGPVSVRVHRDAPVGQFVTARVEGGPGEADLGLLVGRSVRDGQEVGDDAIPWTPPPRTTRCATAGARRRR